MANHDDPAQILMRQRDHMLTQALAIENKVAGLNMAIKIVAEELAAQGIETRSAIDAKRRGPKGESPVRVANAPKPNHNHRSHS